MSASAARANQSEIGTVTWPRWHELRGREIGVADSSQTLDVYAFTSITKSSPTLIFQLNGLVKGDARISGYNTVMTAEVDQLSTINAGKPISAMTADLFREFKWSESAGKMVQTVFPGIFPDLTRYQAETDQAAVNQGHQPWKLSATLEQWTRLPKREYHCSARISEHGHLYLYLDGTSGAWLCLSRRCTGECDQPRSGPIPTGYSDRCLHPIGS